MKKMIFTLAACAAMLLAFAPIASARSETAALDLEGIQEWVVNSPLLLQAYNAYTVRAHRNYGFLSRINAQSHLAFNQALDDEFYADGMPAMIDWQTSGMKYGTRDLRYNGCELIAVYNVLLHFGSPRDMSKIIYEFERNGALWLEGEFGTKIAQYTKYLKTHGFQTESFKNPRALDDARMDGDVFILTYRNAGGLTIHTVMVWQKGGQLIAYNVWGGPFDSFEDLLNRKGAYLKAVRVSG